MLLSKSIFCHFGRRKRKSLIKLIDTFLMSSAIPFLLSSLFLRSPFHIENSECTILCMVSRFLAALADLRFYPVLQQIAIQCPVHAFYRPVIACQRTQRRSVCWQTAHAQPLFSGLCAGLLLYRVGFIFYNRHVSSSFFLVGYDVKTVKDTITPERDKVRRGKPK